MLNLSFLIELPDSQEYEYSVEKENVQTAKVNKEVISRTYNKAELVVEY